MSGSWLRRTAHDLPSWESDELDTDMAFAQWMRQRVWFMSQYMHQLMYTSCRVISCMSAISMTMATYSMETHMTHHVFMETCTRCLIIPW